MSIIGVLLVAPVSGAAAVNSKYVYTFDGKSASDTVIANEAADNSALKLNLTKAGTGSWSAASSGLQFNGGSSGTALGFATKPAGGAPTLVAPDSIGNAIRFTYQGPQSCGSGADTSNLTQAGRAGAGLSQLKLQLTKCTKAGAKQQVQCRVAGKNTGAVSSSHLTTSSVDLVVGETYIARCIVDVDTSTSLGDAAVELTVQPLSTAVTTSSAKAQSSVGGFSVDGYVSVANKYSGPGYGDQFNGIVSKVAYCTAGTGAEIRSCLEEEIPPFGEVITPQPPVLTAKEWVTNQGFETSLQGWGRLGNSSLNSFTRSYVNSFEGTRAGRVEALANALGTKLGITSNPRVVASTVLGTHYRASAYVAPDQPLTISLRIREINPSGKQVGMRSSTVVTTSSGWVQLPLVDYAAVGNGNTLVFDVYSDSMVRGNVYYIDTLSLTTDS